jgi:two-component system, cell cycle response regulator DivK
MKNKTILLIDDNELNRKLVEAILQASGVRILFSENAERGIEIAHENKPNLILMDIRLPGMDGWTATRIIKENPDLQDIPVIVLTAAAYGEVEAKAMEVGCAGIITKPFSASSLIEMIEQYIK